MPLSKVPIVEAGNDSEKTPFKMAEALKDLDPGATDQAIVEKLEAQKTAFQNKIGTMNKKLDDAYDSERYRDPGPLGLVRHFVDWGLNDQEYQVVINDTQAQLNDMESLFNEELRVAGYKEDPNEKALQIVDAMQTLNNSLNNLVKNHLDYAISTADDVDANTAAFASRVYGDTETQMAESEEKEDDLLAQGAKAMQDPEAAAKRRMRQAGL
jgi:hypothetical protein